jgi:F0F1-type ATP synthase membrane subunit c/vacuolar-type H+-ATPase subunit K
MDKLRAAYRVTVIIGLAIMASLVVYLVIVQLFEGGSIELQGDPAFSGSRFEFLKFVLIGVSVIIFFLIRFLNNLVFKLAGEERGHASRPAPVPGAPTELGKLSTAAIITFALCETPAIFGLVLYFLGRNATDFYLFLIISMFFFASHFPKFSQWEEWYRRRHPGQGVKRTE